MEDAKSRMAGFAEHAAAASVGERAETRKANKKLRKICLGKLSDEAGRTTLRESVYYLTLFKSRGLSNARPHGRNKRVESPCALWCCACGTMSRLRCTRARIVVP